MIPEERSLWKALGLQHHLLDVDIQDFAAPPEQPASIWGCFGCSAVCVCACWEQLRGHRVGNRCGWVNREGGTALGQGTVMAPGLPSSGSVRAVLSDIGLGSGCPVRTQGADSALLTGPFQLTLFCDSVTSSRTAAVRTAWSQRAMKAAPISSMGCLEFSDC